jgi:hypothetical protein
VGPPPKNLFITRRTQRNTAEGQTAALNDLLFRRPVNDLHG